ncbi:unannotated protein [freshwater metagenome]|jgi:hypothetical protein|uniref:Unannotated protein n=1 Tax=freshwater metagenome TaxID=449393 RepID=A0A6J6CWV3_9ZZZZ|nr:hypothetical protein [Actinomycetota bacterium]MTA81309.1 hypothetical protein [Actinomycetota bacterium]
MKRGFGGWLLVILFGVLLGHDVWEGAGNVIGKYYESLQLGLELTWVGWLILGTNLLAPVVLFIIGLVATRRKSFGDALLIWILAVLVAAIAGADVVLAGNDYTLFYTVTTGN